MEKSGETFCARGLMARRSFVGVIALFLAAGMLAPANAGLISGLTEVKTLEELLQPGESVQVGDKIFENWEYQVTGLGSGSFVSETDQIIITFGYDDAAKVAKVGYNLVAQVDAPGQWADLLWTYTVRQADGLATIKDVGVSLAGSGAHPSGVPGAPSVNIVENIYDGNGLTDPLIASLAASDVDPNDYVDWGGTYGAVDQIYVFKNLLLRAGDNVGDWAHISYMEQEISQVPEASSLALFGLGLVCLGLGRRFRRRSE